MPEQLIVVNGMAGAGKTTLAEPLAHELSIPFISKDAIKEALADAVPAQFSTRALGGIALDVLWRMASLIEGTVMIESAWLANRDEKWFRDGWASLGHPPGIEVWCEAPVATMRERFVTRSRHIVHTDADRVAEWNHAAESARPMTGFPVVRVDTQHPVDVAALAARLRALTDTRLSEHEESRNP